MSTPILAPTARFTKTDPERTLEPVMAADLIECSVEAIKDILTAIAQLDPISGHATDTLRESIEKRADWILRRRRRYGTGVARRR
jgi:isoleucyl-tRNA synthetase